MAVAAVGRLRPGRDRRGRPAFLCAKNWLLHPADPHLHDRRGRQPRRARRVRGRRRGRRSARQPGRGRRAQAAEMQADAETLAHLSGTLLSEQDPVPALMSGLRNAVRVRGRCRCCATSRACGASRAAPGTRSRRWQDVQVRVPLDADTLLALCGEDLAEEDLHMLRVFTGQLALAVERRRRLPEAAAAAEGLAEANELRTALLVAVSHDLRTPLSSIKASVTSLRQRDARRPTIGRAARDHRRARPTGSTTWSATSST